MLFRNVALALALGCGLTMVADAKPKHTARPRAIQPRVKRGKSKSKNRAFQAGKVKPRKPPKHMA
jgi:hypothetical protein